MAAASTHEKACRYLAAGRLTVHDVREGLVRASCTGGETYKLGYNAGEWWCSCPARTTCAHLLALQLVVDQPRRPAASA